MKRKRRYTHKPGESRLLWKEHMKRKDKRTKWEKRLTYSMRRLGDAFRSLASTFSDALNPAMEYLTRELLPLIGETKDKMIVSDWNRRNAE